MAVSDGPTVLRFPKANVGAEAEAVGKLGTHGRAAAAGAGARAPDVLLIGAGPMALTCLAAADRLADQGIGVTVVDPRWVKPLDGAGRRGRPRRPGWW